MKACRFPAALFLLGLLAWLNIPASVRACPFCAEERGPTLISDFDEATMVLLGSFSNAKLEFTGGLEVGTTDFTIDEALKSDKFISGKKQVVIPRYHPNLKGKYIIFADVFKGVVDAYRAVEVKQGGDMVKYLRGALTMKNRPAGDRLRYCFDFLQSTDTEVSLDAYREFARADYTEYRDMATKLDPNVIAGWLKDPNTRPYRFGLYASLLGHCGTTEHAKLLRQMIEDPRGRMSSGIDGLLAGYVMLLHKEGKDADALNFLKSEFADTRADFNYRWSLVRTMRFFWDSRRDIFAKQEKAFFDTAATALNSHDVADFLIDDLNRWNRWELADKVLDLSDRETHKTPVIQDALLRYALRCPAPRARKYVAERRKQDPERVLEIEEALKRQFKDFQPGGK